MFVAACILSSIQTNGIAHFGVLHAGRSGATYRSIVVTRRITVPCSSFFEVRCHMPSSLSGELEKAASSGAAKSDTATDEVLVKGRRCAS